MNVLEAVRGGAAVVLAIALTGVVSCGEDEPAGPAPRACTEATECDDAQLCTIDACVDGLCVNQPMPNGDALEQTDGDCQKIRCVDGVAEAVNDAGDAADDLEPCTLDVCDDGATRHVDLLDLHPCINGMGTGVCHGGQCQVPCTELNAQAVCDDLNPCTEDSCAADEYCDNVAVADGVLDDELQIVGDCHEIRCLAGLPFERIDDEDVPEDEEPCTADQCSDGTPSNVEFSCTPPEWCGGGDDPNACGCTEMSNTESQSPQAATQKSLVGSETWSGVTSVLESDGTSANTGYMSEGDVSVYLVATDFGFDIPDHATIAGIEVEWQRSSSSGSGLVDYAVRLNKQGLVGIADRSSDVTWPAASTPVYVSYGGATDTWGETWTPADVNSPLFGAALAVAHEGDGGGDYGQVDHVRITIHYGVDCP